MAVRFGDVPQWHLAYVWAEVSPLLARVLQRSDSGRYLPDDILKLLLRGDAKLWVVWDDDGIKAAVVTQIVQFPRLKELRIWLVGAVKNSLAIETMKNACAMLEDYGRAHGCALMGGGLRRGWQRMTTGFKETGVLYEKKL